MEYQHTPVMLAEAVRYLDPQKGGRFIDCTLGGGGYTIALAEMVGKEGVVVGFDLDPLAIRAAGAKIKENGLGNVWLIRENFRYAEREIKNLVPRIGDGKFDGIVLDLGLSSAQLADRHRGFSFGNDPSPLVMTFSGEEDGEEYASAREIVNTYKPEEIERVLRDYGEEKFAGRISRRIAEARKVKPINTVGELVRIIEGSVPPFQRKKGKIHPATKTFQALRIEANQELTNLAEILPQALELIGSGGRIVAVSYHSLEDRIIKNFFRKEARDCLCPPEIPVCRCGHAARLRLLTRKAVLPGADEILSNPRARSAKLRAAEVI